ncbi:hypothetical protein CXB51_013865 [Gossypium anomalum]|uniref:Uncharacterized protein n=1 Tax=Gossypium anomalum TaxID=47600 RepID=A0A8J5Z376_9ROSI|nr:hypothetical protein CXB51_013865 [Gossypium anomalum]
MNVLLDKRNYIVCMVDNADPNAGISSKTSEDGGRLLLHRKGSSTIPLDTSLHGSCFGSRNILGDETHAKGGMLVSINEVVKSSTHRLESIASDGSNLMINEYRNKSNDDEKLGMTGLGESTRMSESRRSRSENEDLSNANIGGNPMPRKPNGSSARFVHGGTMRYDAKVTYAILLGKTRTTFNKRVPVPETYTGE